MSKRVAVNILSVATIAAPIKIEDLDEKRIVPKMMIRRRLTRNTKIMLYLADKCGFNGTKIVYGSAYGELQATAGITDAILNGTQISPTLFQNSVYNSAPSYYSLLNDDKDEILTISSGKDTSKTALQTAALQALLSGEKVLCVVTECLNIANIEEINSCTNFLESGCAVVLEIANDETDAVEIALKPHEGIVESLWDIMSLIDNYEKGRVKNFITL